MTHQALKANFGWIPHLHTGEHNIPVPIKQRGAYFKHFVIYANINERLIHESRYKDNVWSQLFDEHKVVEQIVKM